MNTESYIGLTVNAFRVLSQAVADAGCIVGFAVQNAFKGLFFALVRADNFELYVTKSVRQFRFENAVFSPLCKLLSNFEPPIYSIPSSISYDSYGTYGHSPYGSKGSFS